MNIKSIGKNLVPAATVAGGTLAAKYAAKYIPVANPKLQSVLIMGIGLFLSGRGKAGLMHNLGLGMAAGGAVALLDSFGIGGPDSPIMELDEIDGVPEAVYGPGEGEAEEDLDAGSGY